MKSQVNLLTCIRRLNSSCVSWFYQGISGLRELAGTWWPLCLKESMPFNWGLPSSPDCKGLPAVQETQVQSLSQKRPWEETATHCSILAWRRNGYPLQYSCLEKKCLRTAVFLPGESHGQRNLESYSPWGHKESDMTEKLQTYMPFTPGPKKPNFSLSEVHLEVGVYCYSKSPEFPISFCIKL